MSLEHVAPAGFTIAFVYGWKMTLVTLAAIPLMGAAGYFQVTSYTHPISLNHPPIPFLYAYFMPLKLLLHPGSITLMVCNRRS